MTVNREFPLKKAVELRGAGLSYLKISRIIKFSHERVKKELSHIPVHFVPNLAFASVKLCGVQESDSPPAFGTVRKDHITCKDCLDVIKQWESFCR